MEIIASVNRVLFICMPYLLFEGMLAYYVSGSHCNDSIVIIMEHNGLFP